MPPPSTPPAASGSEPAPRRISLRGPSVVGLLIAVVGGAFVAETLASEWDTVTDTLERAEPGWLVGGLAVAPAAMLGIALPWRHAIRAFGHEVGRFDTVRWYFLGEIGKYIPGGIWPVVGRAELARRADLPRPAAYGSTTLSLAAAYLAAMLATVALLPLDLGARFDAATPLWVLVLLPLGLLALHHQLLEALVVLARRLLRRELDIEVPRWGSSVVLVLRYVPAWLLVGVSTWMVARGLDPGAEFSDVAFAATLSWVVGFLVVPAPGGLGVREAVFVAAAGLPAGVGAATAVAARLAFVAVDAAGAAVSAALLRPRLSERGGGAPD